jgi:hypothetical protein
MDVVDQTRQNGNKNKNKKKFNRYGALFQPEILRRSIVT